MKKPMSSTSGQQQAGPAEQPVGARVSWPRNRCPCSAVRLVWLTSGKLLGAVLVNLLAAVSTPVMLLVELLTTTLLTLPSSTCDQNVLNGSLVGAGCWPHPGQRERQHQHGEEHRDDPPRPPAARWASSAALGRLLIVLRAAATRAARRRRGRRGRQVAHSHMLRVIVSNCFCRSASTTRHRAAHNLVA